MVGAAHGDRIQSCGGLIRHNTLPLQNHGQGTGPELPRQHVGHGRNIPAVPGQPLRPCDMEDQGIVLRAPFGFKNPLDGLCIQAVGTQAIHCLRGDCHQTALPQNLGGG